MAYREVSLLAACAPDPEIANGFREYPRSTVGASLLAMDVNDNAGGLTPRGAWASIASRLAPTGEGCCEPLGDQRLSPHREQARSHRDPWWPRDLCSPKIKTVGASLLAMDVNDNAGGLTPLSACASIASMLAPTSEGCCEPLGVQRLSQG